ncbi:T9SS C-terminal target domain-containing protein [Paracoccus liaowanqingii]|uniref:T9SS C-terminal target domain-containing protein n=1 Tax=Paracoccus liaowanqingii TaxID=2560053 RepID=A0A4Z1BHA9_9RHOB|nr:T9SS C-terminal target domain-containing protein [Paracoccus liaowanqingii]TGN45878.1 T9SS C-terminal target domain-containing protein [Paracoccus liaowanqingii]
MTCPPARLATAAAALWITLGAPALAEIPPAAARDEARIYFFGNSLVHHLTDSDETTVPHWMALMARQDGREFGADGRWGFPRNFATELPPHTNWEFAEVEKVWNSYRQPFGAAGFDTIIFNPENFIQYDRADQPYNGDNPDRATPLGATMNVVDWVMENAEAPQFLIYEGWADLHPFAREFPPTAPEMAQYYAHASGTYARWYDDYVARLAALRPDAGVALIPVGRVMAQVLSEEPLVQIPAEVLYSDRSPHGTETVYLLAAMITYASIYGAPPPAGMQFPDTIDPTFAAAYDQTAERIWQILQDGAR